MSGSSQTPGVRRDGGAERLIALGCLLLIGTGFAWHAARHDVPAALVHVLETTRAAGPIGVLFFILAYILAALLMLPASILTLSAGFLYGVVGGTAAVSAGSTLGAASAFLAGRYLARGRIERRLAGWPKLGALDAAVGREGFKIVLLTRLSPLFPFNIVNYAFGLTRVRFRTYFIASWFGMLPVTVLYVWIGATAGDLARIGSSSPANRWVTALRWAGLAATAIVTIVLTRIARRALKPVVNGAIPEESR